MLVFRRLLGLLRLSARVQLTLHEQPAVLVDLNSVTGEKRKTSLLDVLKKCPSLYGDKAWYTPTSWLSRWVLSSPLQRAVAVRSCGRWKCSCVCRRETAHRVKGLGMECERIL